MRARSGVQPAGDAASRARWRTALVPRALGGSQVLRRVGCRHAGGEVGQVSLLILGFAVVVMLLVVGTMAVTSAQLSRMRLLDAADGAALDAADSLDAAAYRNGLGTSVAVSDDTVVRTAAAYLQERPLPVGMLGWEVAAGSGSPDGETAVVRLQGETELPWVGPLLDALGGSVTITVESRARSGLQPVP